MIFDLESYGKVDFFFFHQIVPQILSTLIDWMDAINLRGYTSIPPEAAQPYLPSPPSQLQVSFHLSLHRYFAAFLSQAVFLQDKPIESLLPSSDVLLLLMSHPLQAQVIHYFNKRIFVMLIIVYMLFTHFSPNPRSLFTKSLLVFGFGMDFK